jgi:acyl-coenzyme A thioesterase PaaI-like protein
MKAIQDYYPDELSHCFGCGRLNAYGHQLRSFWNGEASEARFTPQPFHTALPGFVNGGVLASLVDCHGTGTAAAAAYRAEGRGMDTLPAHRFVTASLRVDYLRPTPLGPELLLHGRVRSISGRTVVVEVTVSVGRETTVRGEVVAVEMPDSMRLPAVAAGSRRSGQ